MCDTFGYSVSISGDTVVVGAHAVGSSSGAAYVFARSVPTDLSITKTDSVDPVAAGSPLTYTITVQNFGPGVAQDVVVTDTLPVGVTFVSTSGCNEDPGGESTCTLGTIVSGDFDDYTITVTVDPATTETITNQATVSSSTPEANPGDESASEMTTVIASADLSITKTDSVDPVGAGDPLTYSITVRNDGPSDAQNVVVTDTLPSGVTFVSTSGCAEDPSGAPTCTLGTVPAGMQQQYTVTVAVDAGTIGIITNQADVSSSTPEALPGNENVSEATEVVESNVFADDFESGDTTDWN